MQYTTFLHILACHIVVVLAVALIADRRYEDGCIGRFALIVLAITCVLVLWEFWMTDVDRYIRPTTAWFSLGVMIFMARHAYRHWRFGRSRRLASGNRVHA